MQKLTPTNKYNVLTAHFLFPVIYVIANFLSCILILDVDNVKVLIPDYFYRNIVIFPIVYFGYAVN